jgi:hypothetical protein
MASNNSKNAVVSEDVANLILEALSTKPLTLADGDYLGKINEMKEIRKCLKVDVPDRQAPYQLSDEAKNIAIQALVSISVPVTHPNWVTLTELLIKARVELGIVE